MLSHGAIDSIKINLPGNDNKASKNVEVKVNGVELVMEPNQHFKETFEQNIKQMK